LLLEIASKLVAIETKIITALKAMVSINETMIEKNKRNTRLILSLFVKINHNLCRKFMISKPKL
jgi:hypothetical protein